MTKYIIILVSIFIPTALISHTITIKNNTKYDIRALILYMPGSEMVSTAFTALGKEPRIDQLDDKMDRHLYGFVGDFNKKNKKYFKQSSLKANDTHKFDIGSGCIRKAKVWIVETVSIPADQITAAMLSEEASTLGKVYKDMQGPEWIDALAKKKPISYIKFKPALSKSWDTKRVASSKNQCASHMFIVREKENKLDLILD